MSFPPSLNDRIHPTGLTSSVAAACVAFFGHSRGNPETAYVQVDSVQFGYWSPQHSWQLQTGGLSSLSQLRPSSGAWSSRSHSLTRDLVSSSFPLPHTIVILGSLRGPRSRGSENHDPLKPSLRHRLASHTTDLRPNHSALRPLIVVMVVVMRFLTSSEVPPHENQGDGASSQPGSKVASSCPCKSPSPLMLPLCVRLGSQTPTPQCRAHTFDLSSPPFPRHHSPPQCLASQLLLHLPTIVPQFLLTPQLHTGTGLPHAFSYCLFLLGSMHKKRQYQAVPGTPLPPSPIFALPGYLRAAPKLSYLLPILNQDLTVRPCLGVERFPLTPLQ